MEIGDAMSSKSISVNVSLNTLYTLINIIFPIITYPYVLRTLSVDGVGIVNFFSALSGYAVMLADLGLGLYGIRSVAKVREDREKMAKIVRELLYINIISTIFILVLYFFVCMNTERLSNEISLIVINLFLILTAPLSMNWFFSGIEEYSYITIRTIIVKSITLIMIFMFVKQQNDFIIYAGIIALSSIMTSFCNYFRAKKIVRFDLGKDIECRKHLKPMLVLFGSMLAVSVYVNLDTVMLGFICNDREVGLYTTAVKVKTLLLSLVNAVSVVMLPRLSYYLAKKMFDDYNVALKKSIDLILLVTLPMALFFIIKAYDCIYILGGVEFYDATLCMQILMPILVISGFSNILGNQVLIPFGMDSAFTKAVSVGATVDIILNLILMKPYGCYGAAVATLVAECCQMSFQLKYSKRFLHKVIDFSNIKKIILGTIIATLSLVGSDILLKIYPILDIVISTLVYSVIYLTCLYLLNSIYIIKLLQYVKCKLKTL